MFQERVNMTTEAKKKSRSWWHVLWKLIQMIWNKIFSLESFTSSLRQRYSIHKVSIKYNIFNGDVSSIFLCVKLLDKGPNLNRIAGVVAIFFLSVILYFSRIWSFMVVCWGWGLGLRFWAWVFQLMGFGTCGVGSSSFFLGLGLFA